MVYDGQALPVPQSRGFELIHYLMRHSGQAVACRVLATVNCEVPAVVQGRQPECTDLNQCAENQSELTEHSAPDLTERAREYRQPVLDGQALNEIRQAMEELGEEIKTLAELGERDRVEELEAKREFCEKELARNIYRGRSREFDTSEAKNRKAVQKSIRAAIKSLESDHPKLARHLADSISTGWQCGYYPAETMDWELGEPKMLPAKAQCHRGSSRSSL
ncbi:MAG: hypothetical protein EBS84_20955 [Proteobacteria bacterium]|nr:hypothetical protein [Verrucomicrobiota bacterium]NBU11446.1 hypothetical protein [Pseudomonadota bacterium]